MTDPKPKRAALGLMLLVAVGAAWWWFSGATTPDRDKADAPAGSATEPVSRTAGESTLPAAATALTPPEPLPLGGAPLGEILAPLQARADAGGSQAACRLAIELLRCVHLERGKKVTTPDGRPMDVIVAEQGNAQSANAWAETDIRRIHLRQQCEQVDPALLAAAPRYLAAAARAGEPEAMLRYAMRDQDGSRFSQAFARDPDFERWRRDAPAMLRRALHAGKPEAVDVLASAYRSDGTPLSALIVDDPVQARAYQLLSARLRGPAPGHGVLERPAEEARAQALAADWHGRHFGNRILSQEEFPYMLAPLDTPFGPPQDERFCERPAG